MHAIAMHGLPKHPPGFSHLPYVNPDAPRGGRLVLGQQGTFDSLNPFVVKGRAAAALRNYVYESLLARSGDEPFTLYGLIAESIEVPPDRSSATFHLRPEARFADGQPVTPDDVLFSHAFLKDKGYPFYREHYRKVSAIEKIGDRSVRFTFNAAGDREIPLILGLMPILPRHKFDGEPTLEPPLGSGAYRVAHVDPGRS
ncbi:MAG TPA: ABC transporter substrate-binding protein, partial [Hyphomicrobiaceae bacterium]|nr:ABC transporter substrate-binding protein [Hyphomicrobiaceae bacterium]